MRSFWMAFLLGTALFLTPGLAQARHKKKAAPAAAAAGSKKRHHRSKGGHYVDARGRVCKGRSHKGCHYVRPGK